MKIMDVPEIDVATAAEELHDGSTIFVDVRDAASFREARVPGAVHVDDSGVAAFVNDTDPEARVVVYCYHGHMSLGGAAYFQQHGLSNAVSMRGGFAGWRAAGHATESS